MIAVGDIVTLITQFKLPSGHQAGSEYTNAKVLEISPNHIKIRYKYNDRFPTGQVSESEEHIKKSNISEIRKVI